MEVKGTAIKVMPAFIKDYFQEAGLNQWLQVLPVEVREAYANPILSSAWYDLRTYFLNPTIKICELFYQSQSQGAFDLGVFSADYALRGVYRFFVKLGSPDFTLRNAAKIMSNYYKPSILEMTLLEKNKPS